MANLYSAKTLPSKGTPGDYYFHAVDRTLHIALADGRLWDLAGLLSAQPVGVVGKQGEPGERGAVGSQGAAGINGRDSTVAGPQGLQGPMGPKGSTGPAARDGIDGRDSTVAGPKGDKGDSIVGPRGEKGDRGDVLIPNDSELAASVIELRQSRARTQAALILAMAESKTTTPQVRLHLQRHLKQIKEAAGI